MSAAQLYATITFLSGVILLLGWLYLTIGNPQSQTMLLKSVFLFVLPGTVLVALGDSGIFRFPLSMWVGVLIEECLKATAAVTEQNRLDRYFLIALFGVWELMWVKPLWGLHHSALLADWSNLQLAGLTAAAVITVLMHCVTAEIYAFRFEGRLLFALCTSWFVHVVFNESVEMLGVSLLSSSLQLSALILLFVALWPKDLRIALLLKG